MGEVKNRRNILKLLVIFLFIVVLCLIGYIMFSRDNNSNIINNIVESNSLLDISKLSDYVNYDGTYASIKTINFNLDDEKVRSVSVDMEGKVYVGHYARRQDITNVNKVIDILGIHSDDGIAEDSICYILTEEGNVYKYSLDNIAKDNYEAVLVTDVNNVKRIFLYTYANVENTNSVSGIMAILENGEYVELN